MTGCRYQIGSEENCASAYFSQQKIFQYLVVFFFHEYVQRIFFFFLKNIVSLHYQAYYFIELQNNVFHKITLSKLFQGASFKLKHSLFETQNLTHIFSHPPTRKEGQSWRKTSHQYSHILSRMKLFFVPENCWHVVRRYVSRKLNTQQKSTNTKDRIKRLLKDFP